MGYTHYWTLKKSIGNKMSDIANDFKKILLILKTSGIKIANWDGKGKPIINNEEIKFNGIEKCGHDKKPLTLSLPEYIKFANWLQNSDYDLYCNGDCSHESFVLTKIFLSEMDFCKTAMKPYDIAVTTCLIIAKHYLKEDIEISSDGDEDKWRIARILCQSCLGYGMKEKLNIKGGNYEKNY